VSIDHALLPDGGGEDDICRELRPPRDDGRLALLTSTEASIKPLATRSGSITRATRTWQCTRRGDLRRDAKGVVSRYLLGIDFAPRDLRLALVKRRTTRSARSRPVLLLCYHYDPRREVGAAVLNSIRIGFIATVGRF
jgi:hypothetical protein